MRVATYNIHKCVGLDAKRNPERILDVLNEIDADVVFIQEIDRRIRHRKSTISRELLATHTDYQVANVNVREHSLGWHGNVIFLRKHYEVQKSWRIELPTFEPRGAVAADILIEGQCIRCVATHLGLLKSDRKLQIKTIAETLSTEASDPPVIIGGDFNEWRNSDHWATLFGEGYRSIDTKPTYPSPLPITTLDRIILSPDVYLKSVSVHRSEKSKIASDHLPIWADLDLDTRSQIENSSGPDLGNM